MLYTAAKSLLPVTVGSEIQKETKSTPSGVHGPDYVTSFPMKGLPMT